MGMEINNVVKTRVSSGVQGVDAGSAKIANTTGNVAETTGVGAGQGVSADALAALTSVTQPSAPKAAPVINVTAGRTIVAANNSLVAQAAAEGDEKSIIITLSPEGIKEAVSSIADKTLAAKVEVALNALAAKQNTATAEDIIAEVPELTGATVQKG